MGYSREADDAARAAMKEAADRQERKAAERARAEAENRGEVDARAIVDAMDEWDGRAPYRDEFSEIADIVAKFEEEESAQ